MTNLVNNIADTATDIYNKYGKGAINSLESGFNDIKGAFNQLGDWISSGLQVHLMAQIGSCYSSNTFISRSFKIVIL